MTIDYFKKEFAKKFVQYRQTSESMPLINFIDDVRRKTKSDADGLRYVKALNELYQDRLCSESMLTFFTLCLTEFRTEED